jgi:hypothetical protein
MCSSQSKRLSVIKMNLENANSNGKAITDAAFAMVCRFEMR